MRKRYLVAGLVSSVVYMVAGPFLTILTLPTPTGSGGPEDDFSPIGALAGWILFAGPLTLLVVASALLGEVGARRARRTTGKLLIVSVVSAVLLFGTAALLSTLGDAFLTDWSSMSWILLPGWLVAGAGPRFWWWVAELDTALGELDAEPDSPAGPLPVAGRQRMD